MKKKFYDKLFSLLFVGFITITLILSFAINGKAIIDNLYENKETLFSFRVSDDYIKEVVSILEKTFDREIFLRRQYIDLYGGLQRICNKKIFFESEPSKNIMIGSDNKRYSAGNIMFGFKSNYVDSKEIDKYGEAVSELAKYVKEKDADLIFFLAPARYDADKVKLPISINDNSKENVEYMYSILKDDDNLIVLNSQKIYREQNKDFNELFFRTDHHWNIKTAFWAYSEICKCLNREYDYNIDPFFYDMENYTVETIPDSYLGSYGERVTGLFAGYDDFDLIYPKFETECVKRICKIGDKSIDVGGDIKTEGKFADAILDGFSDIKNGHIKPDYSVYITSDRCDVIINNYKSATKKRILVIKDSFALPVSAFLSTCFEETRLIDLRCMKDMSTYECIDNYNPDLVLILYNPGAYNDVFFDFDGHSIAEKE